MKYTCRHADWTKLSNTRKATSKYWVKESGTILRIRISLKKNRCNFKMKPFWLLNLNETGPNPSLANAGIICWKLILANKQPLVPRPQSTVQYQYRQQYLKTEGTQAAPLQSAASRVTGPHLTKHGARWYALQPSAAGSLSLHTTSHALSWILDRHTTIYFKSRCSGEV